MTRKILFVLFAEDECRRFHALQYVLDLGSQGHDVRLLLEGAATSLMLELDVPGSSLGSLLRDVQSRGLLAGACLGASRGCGTPDSASPAILAARAHNIALVEGMEGHAALGPFVRDGYEIVVI
jgi:hypothetical protein